MTRPLAALALAVVLCGCGTPSATTPPPVQNSPQSTVALTVKTVADSASTCIDTVILLRNQGKLAAGNAKTIGDWCSFVATTDKQLTAILANGQPWTAQKVQILTLLGTVTAPAIATAVDPGAAGVIAQIITLVAQIKVQVQP